jgi:hypothetical protein
LVTLRLWRKHQVNLCFLRRGDPCYFLNITGRSKSIRIIPVYPPWRLFIRG